jgi:hypothetical protein
MWRTASHPGEKPEISVGAARSCWLRLRTQSGPPDDEGGEHDGGGEVGCKLVVAGGDASPILEAAEPALDEVALAIGGLVERMMSLGGRIVRDDRNRAAFEKKATQTIAVVGGVGMSLEFCEGHLDRIEIGAVGRQKEDPCALVADGLLGDRTLVSRQIVHDDDVASFKRRGELGLDIGFEDSPVHRRVDDEGRGEGVATQCGDEGLGLPMPEGGFGSEALALQAASARARHFGGGPGLVEEDQPLGLEPHLRLPLSPPFLSRLADVGAIAFAGQKRFF